MPEYQPLTPEQYSAARTKFSPDQIVQFEQKRKADATANQLPVPTSAPTLGQQIQQKVPMLSGKPVGIGQTIKNGIGMIGDIANTAVKFGASALAAPIDLVRGAMGKAPLSGTFKLPGLQPTRTFQGDTQNYVDTKVSQGKGSTLEDLSQVTDPVLAGTMFLGGAPASKVGLEMAGENLAEKSIVKDAAKIQEMIMPKPTIKEAKLAESQGRLIKGRQPSLLRGGMEDTVLPTKQVERATKTIQEQIPGAGKMDEPRLYSALNNKTGEMYKTLRPQMDAVPLKFEPITKMNKAWETLKESQISIADATEEANVRKLQGQFEERLKKIDGTKNLGDVWDERIDYDQSVPDNVKNANHMSSESLQNKKSIWLQNRRVLNDVINDMESGLGDTSKKAFADMSDMYNAQQNILSKAKVVTSPLPSKIVQFARNHKTALTVGGTILGGGTLYGAAKKAGAPLP